jgi:hypothetical protein
MCQRVLEGPAIIRESRYEHCALTLRIAAKAWQWAGCDTRATLMDERQLLGTNTLGTDTLDSSRDIISLATT